jgi:arsenate reductase (glutaredoxin)
MMKIYHNPRCTKSRECLKFIEEKGFEFEVVDYIKNGISAKEIKEFLLKSGLAVTDIIRTNEDLYKQEYKGKEFEPTYVFVQQFDDKKLKYKQLYIFNNLVYTYYINVYK